MILNEVSQCILAIADPGSSDHPHGSTNQIVPSDEEHLLLVRGYYKFLKCSFWLPAKQHHYITPELIEALIGSVGHDVLDILVHDTLSALLSLLAGPPVVVLNVAALPQTWTNQDVTTNRRSLVPGVLSDSFFACLSRLPDQYFVDKSRAFRTWFQWTNYMATNAVQTEVVYSPGYWSALRTGLVTGATDQRKYCLGIIQQSLSLCRKSFETPDITFNFEKKEATIKQYQKYCTLFEIIVLDRYPNQVQACLPELTSLLGSTSVIDSTWVTALLTAALDPKIQDGVRKPVGNWYLDYAITQPNSCVAHTAFLVEGLLPWATQGNLYTSSLAADRVTATCSHGEAVSEAIARIVMAASGTSTVAESTTSTQVDGQLYSSNADPRREPLVTQKYTIVERILSYIVETGGKIFAPAVIYLLEGLLAGVRPGQSISFQASEIDMVSRISRLPAMPEITAELCRNYCAKLCEYRDSGVPDHKVRTSQSGIDGSPARSKSDQGRHKSSESPTSSPSNNTFEAAATLGDFLRELDRSQHKIIQNDAFAPACMHVSKILDTEATDLLSPSELLQTLDAFWEEADRQDYPRPVATRLAPLMFHPTCVQFAIRQSGNNHENGNDLRAMLIKVLASLHKFSEGRTYLVSSLAVSLRKVIFLYPEAMDVLVLDDFLVRFIENPPVPKKEFLFEVVAAQKLDGYLMQSNNAKPLSTGSYETYYGQREWIGYAAIIDILNSVLENQGHVAKRVMDRLLQPWKDQKAPIPIISKWKNLLQLQVMLILTESCVREEDADHYLDSFMHALILEPWPRYRYLLEWIIARIYLQYPHKAHRILESLAILDENSPVQVASLMKLALLTAPSLDSEDFALQLIVQLIPFSASPKVHIRHEAHWCFPTIFDLAKERGWSSITANPAFIALDKHIRALDKFSSLPWTIRTLKLDAVKDFTLTNIFQGQYIRLETPDMEHVAHEDFTTLHASDPEPMKQISRRVPLGSPLTTTVATLPATGPKNEKPISATPVPATESNSGFFQTKSGFDVAALLPSSGPPSAQKIRPASVILVASLIDNPTNLGGLSRISESFGLEALYIDDLRKTAHKDFKATSVTSEKHFPIRELKAFAIPEFLIEFKRKGYEIVGIEQTDRSGILGDGNEANRTGKDVGTLPKKCVLVLGAERSGITSEVLAVVDRCVEIKTVGVTRSLNVQTAGAIAMYEWHREHVRS